MTQIVVAERSSIASIFSLMGPNQVTIKNLVDDDE